MTIDDLRSEMRGGFEKVDQRFKNVDAKFARLRTETRRGFKKVDDGFNAVDREFEKLRAEMKADGERTRRHFDVMVERMQQSVKIVAEATAHHAVRLEDHDTRIKRLEGQRRG